MNLKLVPVALVAENDLHLFLHVDATLKFQRTPAENRGCNRDSLFILSNWTCDSWACALCVALRMQEALRPFFGKSGRRRLLPRGAASVSTPARSWSARSRRARVQRAHGASGDGNRLIPSARFPRARITPWT